MPPTPPPHTPPKRTRPLGGGACLLPRTGEFCPPSFTSLGCTIPQSHAYPQPHFTLSPNLLNSIRYVTRYHDLCGIKGTGKGRDWPSCASHFRVSQSGSDKSWTEWVWALSYEPHGPVHTWVGGVGGQCDTFTSLVADAALKGAEAASMAEVSHPGRLFFRVFCCRFEWQQAQGSLRWILRFAQQRQRWAFSTLHCASPPRLKKFVFSSHPRASW